MTSSQEGGGSTAGTPSETPPAEDGLHVVFQQSWEYIRHAQDMFWKSFAVLFTVMNATIILTIDKENQLPLTGVISSVVLCLIGFFVCNRIIRVLKEHFMAINKIRRVLGIDDAQNSPIPMLAWLWAYRDRTTDTPPPTSKDGERRETC